MQNKEVNKYSVKRKNWYLWLIAAYVAFGVIIAISDSFVLPVYLTLFPLHVLFFYFSLKTKNLPCILYCFVLLVSHGIGSIPFYLDRENAERTGFGAIGNFDFSYGSLWRAYSYLLVFLIALLIFATIFKKKYHSNFLISFIRQQYNTVAFHSTLNLFPIVSCVVLFSWISLEMYKMHIGLIGLKQTELPFHLTGVLFFARRFLFPIILIWLYVKTQAKQPATIILILYAFFVGITGTSKSASLLVLVPIAFINYLIGKKAMTYLCTVFIVLSYMVIQDLRLVVYELDGNIPIWDLLQIPFLSGENNSLLSFFKGFTNRFYGLKSSVLPVQNYDLSFQGLVSFYTGTPITQVLPDFTFRLFGFNLPDDKAYGVGLGFTGSMTLLSCHNYLYTIIQALIMAIIFGFQNDSIQRIVRTNAKSIYKYGALLVLLYSYMIFLEGISMTIVYFSTIVLIAIRIKVSNQRV